MGEHYFVSHYDDFRHVFTDLVPFINWDSIKHMEHTLFFCCYYLIEKCFNYVDKNAFLFYYSFIYTGS